MYPKRSLLYHRGVDDHAGTYVTDYVYAGVCAVLCVQLIIRIRRQWRGMSDEHKLTSQCEKSSNWYPWNWPKQEVTPIAMTTYALVLLGMSNVVICLLGGLTHQFLQTVEPYEDVGDLWYWLVVWRTGASFAAFVCFSLLIMTEQLLAQEGILRVTRPFRMTYYVIVFIFTLSFFAYNYIPLTGTEDPFSIGPSFIVFFIVMFIYALVAGAVFFRRFWSKRRASYSVEEEYGPHEIRPSNHPESHRYRNDFYTCCKSVFIHCHDNDNVKRDDDVTELRWDLFMTFLSPCIFVSAGILNHLLKSRCADSDDAFLELGCPLPNAFNHNAAMHVIQIVSMLSFFIAENMAITRRSRVVKETFKRIITSSTLKSDVIGSCEVIYTESEEESRRESRQVLLKEDPRNNNVTNRHDDVVCSITSYEAENVLCHQNKLLTSQSESDVDSGVDDLHRTGGEPKFPTYDYDTAKDGNRSSVYDNLSHPVCQTV